MSAVSNITLKSGSVSPTNVTFSPLGQDKEGVWWFEAADSSPYALGRHKISMNLTRPLPAAAGQSSSGRVVRVKTQIHIPVLANGSGYDSNGLAPAPQVQYITRCTMEFIIPESSVIADRDRVYYGYAKELFSDNMFANMIANLQSIY